ncbi:MAG: L,D-transpeptidase [Candidatus Eremiobacterota bacterium]
MKKLVFIILFSFIINFSNRVFSQENSKEEIRICVNIPALTLTVYKNDRIIKQYKIAAGSPKTPTPAGQYKIVSKETDPTWYPMPKPVKKIDDKGVEYTEMVVEDPVPPGPDNPLGKYWMGLDRDDLGIHSTNNPSSIGYSVSHGCIRMDPAQVKEIFDLVQIGTIVDIVYKTADIVVEEDSLYIAAYPDIYFREKDRLKNIKNKLDKTGIPYDEKILKEILKKNSGTFFIVSCPYRVVFQGQDVSVKSIYPMDTMGGKKEFYISLKDWNNISSDTITLDKEKTLATVKGKKISFIFYDERCYVNAIELAKIADMDYQVNKNTRTLIFYSVIIKLNGKPVWGEGDLIQEKPFISVKYISDVMGIKFDWNNITKEARFGDTSFKCVLKKGKSLIPVEKLAEHFSIHVKRENKRLINIYYPEFLLNDISLTRKAFLYHGEIYISLREFGNITGIKFQWKPESSNALIVNKNIKARQFGGTAFLPLSSLVKTGLVEVKRPSENSIFIKVTKIIINNKFLPVEAYRDGNNDEIMIRSEDMFPSGSQFFLYNSESKTATFNGETINAIQRKEGIYVSLTELSRLKGFQIDYARNDCVIRIFVDIKSDKK